MIKIENIDVYGWEDIKGYETITVEIITRTMV